MLYYGCRNNNLNIHTYDVWNWGSGFWGIACFADMAGVSCGWNFIGGVALEGHQEVVFVSTENKKNERGNPFIFFDDERFAHEPMPLSDIWNCALG